MEKSVQACVIGGGPGGYVAAIGLAQRGFKTVVVEKGDLGGVCLNVGCIPSKALISASHFYHRLTHDAQKMGIHLEGPVSVNMVQLQKWKSSICTQMAQGVAHLLKGNGVEVIQGEASFLSPHEIEIQQSSQKIQLKSDHFVIATGSRPAEIPGFKFDEEKILSSTGALALSEIPKRVAVIGGGYIGLEIGTLFSKLGSKVTIIEAAPSLLHGMVDKDVAQILTRQLKKLGVDLHTESLAKGYQVQPSGEIELEIERPSKASSVTADRVLIAVGRKPNTENLNLKAAGVSLGSNGYVSINPQRRTSASHIFAIGDVAGGPLLAHKASFEGLLVADVLSGKNRVYDVRGVAAVVFTDPELASVGLSEAEALNAGYENLKIGRFPFAANGRAVSMIESQGFVKMIANEQGALLGVHIVGPEASNLIGEAAVALEMGATLEDLAKTIHPHPTLNETLMEAAEVALGHPVHILSK